MATFYDRLGTKTGGVVAEIGDTFTAPQTASILKVSVKRVRQMITLGDLVKVADNPVRLSPLEVLALRDKRKAEGKHDRKPASAKAPRPSTDTHSLLILQTAYDDLKAQHDKQVRAIEDGRQQVEEVLREQISDLRQALASAQTEADRPWYRKRKPR